MKSSSFARVPESNQKLLRSTIALALLATASSATLAQAEDLTTNAPPAKADKGPPLPLHQIEGNGGIFATLSAYITNPPRDGEAVGRPAAGFSYVNISHGQSLYALTTTVSPWERLETGFAYNGFNLGNLPADVLSATGVKLDQQTVALYNANARLQLLKENEFDQKWIPALTFGTHFKYNNDTASINQQLGGALSTIGVGGNTDVDFTLYASKLFTGLPRPVLLELGGRATKGVWNGLLGFTPDYQFLFEGNVAVFVTDNLILAAEFRQQNQDYQPIPGLIGTASNWVTIDAAYIINKHLTVAVGYGHFGTVLNNEANAVWGLTTKYEF